MTSRRAVSASRRRLKRRRVSCCVTSHTALQGRSSTRPSRDGFLVFPPTIEHSTCRDAGTNVIASFGKRDRSLNSAVGDKSGGLELGSASNRVIHYNSQQQQQQQHFATLSSRGHIICLRPVVRPLLYNFNE